MNILIATDGSEHSEKALEEAAKFVFPAKSEFRIISVCETIIPVNMDIYAGGAVSPISDTERIARENAEKILESALKYIQEKLPENNYFFTTEVLFGSPESKIVENAEKMNADLIIVGSHGYNTWERILLGSVSDSVVHHAPCSVLVVRSSNSKEK